MSEKIFEAEIPHLPQMLKWLRSELKSDQVPESIQKKMELAAEEALVNIIHHAYQSKGGKIFLDLNVVPEKVELVVVDQGPALANPFQIPCCTVGKIAHGSPVLLKKPNRGERNGRRERKSGRPGKRSGVLCILRGSGVLLLRLLRARVGRPKRTAAAPFGGGRR